MKLVLLALLFYSFSAQAIDPEIRTVLDQYLNSRKSLSSPEEMKKLEDHAHDLLQVLSDLNLQNDRITDTIRENEKSIDAQIGDFNEARSHPKNPYRTPEIRNKMIEKLSKDCCKMAGDPKYYAKRVQDLHEKWEAEVDKWSKQQKTKPPPTNP